jgi:pimeloyl-ACP methyl ester carboxylesterase
MTTRARSRRRTMGTAVFAGGLLVVLAFLVYASTPMTAEAAPLNEVRHLPGITVTETADSVILSPPSGAPDATSEVQGPGTDDAPDRGERGLVFFAGARVEPAAYVAKLSGVARDGTTVVIVRPVLGFGILEWRPIESFTALAPGVDSWLVGGHSLGGVRACQYVADQTGSGDVTLDALVLVGSYCAADIASSDVAVVSISGSSDGLSTPDKIDAARQLLPASTTFVEIDGASHASFGDYGVQPGDGEPTADDADVTADIARAVAALD